MWWGKAKSKLVPDEFLKKHVSEENMKKLQGMDDLYIGVKNSIENSIVLSTSFARDYIFEEVIEAIEECGNRDKCPVNSFVSGELCKECSEKHCDRHKEI
jgi:hypothetical protein